MKYTLNKICNQEDCEYAGIPQPIENFYLVYHKSRNKTYRRGHCKYCDNKRTQKYHKENAEKISKRKFMKNIKDPFNSRLYTLNRRAGENGCLDMVTLKEYKRVWLESGFVCHYCGKRLNVNTFTIDHAQPISKGGGNVYNNLRVCCLSCNSKKQDLTEFEYFTKIERCPF